MEREAGTSARDRGAPVTGTGILKVPFALRFLEL